MKISIVTPVLNGESYIQETIHSILGQEGDFEIEYVVADGLSSDGTLEMVRQIFKDVESGNYPIKCKHVSVKLLSQKDSGLYDAINMGFSHTSGEVMAYLNADDVYRPGALQTVANIFTHSNAEWISGKSDVIDEESELVSPGKNYWYNRTWIMAGLHGRKLHFIQQDSVFWKRSLWIKIGSIDKTFKLAGDLYLWQKFSQHADLINFDLSVSAFRLRKGQLSSDLRKYLKETTKIQFTKLSSKEKVFLFLARVAYKLLKQDAARRIFTKLFPEFSAKQVSLNRFDINEIKFLR